MDYTVNVIEALIVIGGIIGVVAVGLSVSGRMTKWWSSALYALITASLAVLVVTGLYALDAESSIATLWYVRLSAISVVVALTCLYFLVQELADTSKYDASDRVMQAGVVWVAVVLILLSFTPFLFSDAYRSVGGDWLVEASWGALLFVVFFTSLFVLIGYQLLQHIRGAYHRRHGVLDLRFVAVRTISYLCSLFVIAVLFCSLAYALGYEFLQADTSTASASLSPATLVSALIVALVFQPVRRFFNKYIDKLLYKGNYTISDFSVRISQTLNSTNDLRTLLERTADTIASTMKANQAFFFVHLPETRYMIAGTHGHSKMSPAEFQDIGGSAEYQSVPLLAEQFDKSHTMHRMMVSHRLGLIMPLYKGDVSVGFLCLGQPRGAGYSSRDIRALRTVADELTIAIQNALSVEEVRKLNDTLEQRIGSATKELRTSNAQLQRLDEAKDEFISMASHQLRTPLTSIKGYISMLLEGDIGAVTKEQKHVLNEAFVSSERMVRLIGDFLNVSRLQTGKFVIDKHPVNLALLIEREVDGLAQNASARGVKFSYKKPKNIPPLALDENKIQQVVMNFADNAIFYSKEKSKVVVSLEKVGEFVEFKVVDTGIGVPKEEQAQLFNKFFRATNARKARPDGTGVGLFLAKKVISDHGGTVIFESEEGKGSTFGFRLPLPR